jgi:shikimate dehydrogenase
VTLPFKEAAYRYCDEVSPEGRLAGAVNTLALAPTGTRGENTDGSGLLRDLTVNLGFSIRGRVILVLGAAGPPEGCSAHSPGAGATQIVIANRTVSKAQELAQRFPLRRSRRAILMLLQDAISSS